MDNSVGDLLTIFHRKPGFAVLQTFYRFANNFHSWYTTHCNSLTGKNSFYTPYDGVNSSRYAGKNG